MASSMAAPQLRIPSAAVATVATLTAEPTEAELAAATRTHWQAGFCITTRKLAISRAGAIDALAQRLGIPPPEMIFGANAVEVRHQASGWTMRFDAADALDAVDKTGRDMLQVAHARAWADTRTGSSAAAAVVVRPFDWSYSTPFRGSVVAGPPFAPATTSIPVELLQRRENDPILFFDDVVLYESELDDNGVSLLSVKVRVHAARMLLLSRLFMRLDGVLVRLRDTRVYVDFADRRVTREYTAREEAFDLVKQKLLLSGRLPDHVSVSLRDPNILAPLLPVVAQDLEAVELP